MSKVVVGMSGGVDSSVTAMLLKEQGYEVIGATMNIWNRDHNEPEAVADAKKVADHLGIRLYVINCRDEFERNIIRYFSDTYRAGRTPNPCIFCNRLVKWDALLKMADRLDAAYVATGHYASVMKLPNGRFTLKNSEYGKDQTYALYRLTQEQLARTRMPLGDYSKDDVRRLAAEAELPVAAKPDSQDICFIPDGDYAGFLEKQMGIKSEPGNFVLQDGTVLGRHKGLIHYTVGQRRGLGISAPESLFVLSILPEKNEILLGYKKDTASCQVLAKNINLMAEDNLFEKRTLIGKIRYNHGGAHCTAVQTAEDMIECLFEEPVFGVAPGQSLVLYDGDMVFGGGIIVGGDKNESRCTCTL